MQLPESWLNNDNIRSCWWEKTENEIHAMAREIASLHQPKLKKPITFQYNNDNDLDMVPFRVVGDWTEDWIAKIALSNNIEVVKQYFAVYRHIIHHEISHLYNENYKDIWNNLLEDNEIKLLNDNADGDYFWNPEIETWIQEVVTDLTALEFQDFSEQAMNSFLATIQLFLDRFKNLSDTRFLCRDTVRFVALLRSYETVFWKHEQSSALLNTLEQHLKTMQWQFSQQTNEYIEKTITYMQNIATQCFQWGWIHKSLW
jgi:hypothetical protein